MHGTCDVTQKLHGIILILHLFLCDGGGRAVNRIK